MLVEPGSNLLHTGLVDDLHVCRRVTEGANRHVGFPVHRDAAFGRTVRIDHLDTVPLREARDHLGRTLVAKGDPQRIVGVVRMFGLREKVRERLARVVEVRGAIVADVSEPARTRRSDGPGRPHTASRSKAPSPTCTALEWNNGIHT